MDLERRKWTNLFSDFVARFFTNSTRSDDKIFKSGNSPRTWDVEGVVRRQVLPVWRGFKSDMEKKLFYDTVPLIYLFDVQVSSENKFYDAFSLNFREGVKVSTQKERNIAREIIFQTDLRPLQWFLAYLFSPWWKGRHRRPKLGWWSQTPEPILRRSQRHWSIRDS